MIYYYENSNVKLAARIANATTFLGEKFCKDDIQFLLQLVIYAS